jgi:hypothetical protein
LVLLVLLFLRGIDLFHYNSSRILPAMVLTATATMRIENTQYHIAIGLKEYPCHAVELVKAEPTAARLLYLQWHNPSKEKAPRVFATPSLKAAHIPTGETTLPTLHIDDVTVFPRTKRADSDLCS